jgi:hypothetical protein
MKNYWKNTKYTKLVRIKSDHLSWLRKQKGKKSIAAILEEILDAKILEYSMKPENKIIILDKYATHKRQFEKAPF